MKGTMEGHGVLRTRYSDGRRELWWAVRGHKYIQYPAWVRIRLSPGFHAEIGFCCRIRGEGALDPR